MEWDSPWGKGFPGWHIECSAMSLKYLTDVFDADGSFHGDRAKTIDIHTGGIDHIPIHHTNEIAQAEAATGHTPFVKYWVHHNFLKVDNQKMSKSLGNFYTVDDVIAKGYSPMALKLFFLGAHYRSVLNFTWDGLAGAQKAYDRLLSLLASFRKDEGRTVLSEEKLKVIGEYRSRFYAALENDLQTPEAMSVFWDVIKTNIPNQDKFDLLIEFDSILGLNLNQGSLNTSQSVTTVPSGIAELMDRRAQLRDEKKFEEADKLRDEIAKFGWLVEDTAEGQKVKKTII
jgi:cysteinyl-tRNA synthetase